MSTSPIEPDEESFDPLSDGFFIEFYRDRYDFGEEVLMMIGVLILAWSTFEHHLEHLLWDIEGLPDPGSQPFTEKLPISQRIERLKTSATRHLGADLEQPVRDFCETARDILSYRNAIAHGYPVSKNLGGTTTANIDWRGELRIRPRNTALIDRSTLALILDSLDKLTAALMMFPLWDDKDQAIKAVFSRDGIATARRQAALVIARSKAARIT